MRTATFLVFTLITILSSTLAGQTFQRISTPDELTEDGEYIIGAQAEFGRPFYLLTPQLTAHPISGEIPGTLSADCGAAIWTITHRGEHIALSSRGMWLTHRNSSTELILSDKEYDTWLFTLSDGHLLAADDSRCLRINSLTTSARFGYYAQKGYEDTLTIYKRTIPLNEIERYQRFFDEEWETLCLPFSANLPASVRAYTITGIKGSTLNYIPVSGALQAGQAYLLQAPVGTLATFTGISTTRATTPQPSLLQGTYVPLQLNAGHFLQHGNFSPTSSTCIVPPFRAYIHTNLE